MNNMRSKPIVENDRGYLVEIYEKISDEDMVYLEELYLNKSFVSTFENLN
jgi:hypothetical protein